MARNKEKIAALERHVQHELKMLQGDRFKQRINEEISALLEWLEEVSLKDLFTARQVWECFQRNFIDFPISDEIPDFLTECAKKVHSCMRSDETKLEGIIPKEQYDKLTENLIELEELRNRIIKQAVSSSIFSMMISNVLYSGIKGFIVSENILMKSIPGASSLLKVGMELMNITTLGLAGSIDEKMKGFIESNIQNILKDSERFLVESLDEALLKDLSEELWDAFSENSAYSTTEYIDPEQIESIASILNDFWLHFRKSAIFSKVCNTLIEYFFERNGDKNIRSFLGELGISKDMVLREVNKIAVPTLQKGVVRSHLEKRIRARLAAYYFSESRKAPARKSAARKLSKKTATDEVLAHIKGNSRGLTTAQIKKKTGFSDTKIRGIVYRLKQQGKIRSEGRGVYLKI
jgi:hypothetical protein